MVANLEDTAMELQRRNDKFDTIFQTYLSQRERQKELIDVFDDDMALLHQVKIFSSSSDVKLKSRTAKYHVCCP